MRRVRARRGSSRCGLHRLTVLAVVGLLGLLPWLVSAGTALASGGITYYVAVNGTATDCAAAESSTTPFGSIQPALNCAATDTANGAATATSPDTIDIAAGTYDEHLYVSADVDIVGAGDNTVIDGTHSGTVVTVNLGYTVGTSNLAITDGKGTIVGLFSSGGGFYNFGNLTLTNCAVSGNTAAFGGGIFNHEGAVVLVDSRIFDNDTGLNSLGGGIFNLLGNVSATDSSITENTAGGGGGINNQSGTVTLTNTEIRGNTAYGGGGIYSAFGAITLTNSSVKENSTTTGAGGGIFTYEGVLTLTGTAITENAAPPSGGGIYIDGGDSVVTISNSTVSGNTVSGNTAAFGGGIFSSGTLMLSNSAVKDNTAGGDGGGIYNESTLTLTNTAVMHNTANGGSGSGGGIYDYSGTVTLTKSTVKHNTPDNCAPPGSVSGCKN